MDSIPQEILDYINTSLIQGYTEDQIKTTLLQNGYQESYINAAFAEYKRQTNSTQGVSQTLFPLPNIAQLFTETLSLYQQNFIRIVGSLFLLTFVFIFALILFVLVLGAIVFGLNITGIFVFSPQNLAVAFSQNPIPLLIILGSLVLIYIVYSVYIQTWVQLTFIYLIGGISQKRKIIPSFKMAFSRVRKFYWTQLIFSSLLILSLLFPLLYIVFITWFGFFIYIFSEENINGASALLKSKLYVKKRFWSVLGRLAVIQSFSLIMYIVIRILSETTSGNSIQVIVSLIVLLIMVALTPIYLLYHYVLYTHLKRTAETIVFTPSQKSRLLLSFTPVLAVIAIAGLMGAVVFVSLSNSSRFENNNESFSAPKNALTTPEGRDIQRQEDLETIQGAILYHRVFNSTYPNSLAEIELPNDKTLPTDPLTRKEYEYSLLDNAAKYEICANYETRERNCLTSPKPE